MALSLRRAPSSLTSPGTSARRCKYEVFLSFRGEDTRNGFVSHLFNELKRQGISTFKDDRELEGGATISTELSSAIGDSYLAIVVLSPNYASSSWCLDELTKIVQCQDSILPIFCGVDPSHVRHQKGSYAEAFEAHERKLTSTEGREKVRQWRADLTAVANRTGWHLDKNKCEREIIEDIVKCVRRKVQTTFQLFDSPDKFVERDSALIRLSELLDLRANDVRFIGITGMGGIGKTTLAHRVCDIISQHFDVHCFLQNVREVCAKDGTLVGLQNQLLFSIFKDKDVEFWDARRRDIFTREGLRNNKVLLVLDDVDHLGQLQKLAADKDWFRNGSRIIITTRNRRLLVQHDITLLYEVEGMSDGEAHALFSLKAFKKVQPDEEFLELSEHFVNHAKGVPLVLEVWGSFLYQRDRDAWHSELTNLQKIPHPDVFDSLKISYDGLREEEKSIFLDIACFHKGKHKQEVIDILNRRFDSISSLIVIDILIERSLLAMTHHMHLEMHDLIQDMGREIVIRESKAEPGKHTRIWLLDDLRHVLTANTGTEKVEAIVVNSPKLEEIRCYSSTGFSNMHGLRHLELHNVKIIIISSAPIYLQYFFRMIHLYPSAPIRLPRSLTIISWDFYPFKSLPQSFPARYLTELRMSNSKLVWLWDGIQDFPNLKIMNFSWSCKLTSTPDFTGMPNLEVLEFGVCENLVDIHPSVAVLKRLISLNLRYCTSLERLPKEFEMDSLKVLVMDYCRLRNVPEFSEKMKTLDRLDLHGNAIDQLPSSIGNLVGLTTLDLYDTAIKQLPSSFGNLVRLPDLDLSGTAIKQLPSSIGNLLDLTSLNLSESAIEQLPSSIGNLIKLTSLDLRGSAIKQLPSSIGNLIKLTSLDLSESAIKQLPSSIGNLIGLTSLELSGSAIGQLPSSIGNLIGLTSLELSGSAIGQLPSSIANLVGLTSLQLSNCKRLRELPPLRPPRHSSHDYLYVDVRNCTSLQRLTDPSNLSSQFANLYDFHLYPLNCVKLVEDEGFINYVRSMMVRWITNEDLSSLYRSKDKFTYPGSEIPEWFVNKSEEAGDWLGIAFCFVAAGKSPNGARFFHVVCSSGFFDPIIVNLDAHRGPEHLTMFYCARERCRKECPEAAEAEFSFETKYCDLASMRDKVGFNMVKEWAARWVYKQDLEDLQRGLNITKVLKRTREYYGEEAGPSGSFDDEEPNHKRQKEDWAALD